jgi:antitoxin component YwqK of YwqJK toxin-antitoxin module
MKTHVIIALLFVCIISGCASSGKGDKKITYVASIASHMVLKAINLNHTQDFGIDMKKDNGMIAEVFLGDTIGFQYYVNGLKHGPYFNLSGKGFSEHKIGARSDGMYKRGKKHGYFMRHRTPDELHYIAYYQDGEFLWSEYYSAYRYEVYPRKPMHIENGEMTINAKHPNGRTWFMGSYKDGRPVGIHKIYSTDGKKRGEINYKSSKVVEYNYSAEGRHEDNWEFNKVNFNVLD